MSPEAAGRRCVVFVAPNTAIDRLVEVERLAVGGINRPSVVVAVPGGKGLNAARAALTLGGCARIVAIVGGRSGEWIADELASLGIEASLLRAQAETRTCVSILDRATGELTEVYEPGTSIEPGEWSTLEDRVADSLADGAVAAITVSGSLPRGAPADGYARIVRLAHDRGAIALVDTYGVPLREALAEHPDVVKVNAEEAGDATGIVISGSDTAGDAAARLVKAGARAAVVTLGRAGAVLATAGETWLLTPPPGVGPYAVGSGDAFLGGMAVALAAGEGSLDSARRGMAAAAANTLLAGAGNLDPAAAERGLAYVRSEPR
jgi:1-phosphofructokinase family hexose kinase